MIASYYFERDYAAAIEMAERYLADYPDYAAPRRLIAAALAQLGCREEAAQALEEAIRRSPDVRIVCAQTAALLPPGGSRARA